MRTQQMRTKHVHGNRLVKKVLGGLLVGVCGVLQAVCIFLTGISAVILKPVSVLMILAAGVMFLLKLLGGADTFVLCFTGALIYLVPEIIKLVLIGVTALQVMIIDGMRR